MEGAITRLLDLNDGKLLMPIIICLLVAVAMKALASLGHSHGAARKEFLELFQGERVSDELWLSVAIRHQFGAYLPVPVIQKLLNVDQPARALLEVASAWELIDFDADGGSLVWRRRRHASKRCRRWIGVGHLIGYFVSAFSAGLLAYTLLVSDLDLRSATPLWIWVAMAGGFALWSLSRHGLLMDGSRSIERWLGLT